MTTNLEVYFAVIGVLNVPDDMNGIAVQTIGHGQIEAEGIDLQRFLTLVQGQRDAVLTFANNRKFLVAGKTVTRQMILFAIYAVGVVLNTAY